MLTLIIITQLLIMIWDYNKETHHQILNISNVANLYITYINLFFIFIFHFIFFTDILGTLVKHQSNPQHSDVSTRGRNVVTKGQHPKTATDTISQIEISGAWIIALGFD